MPTLFIPGKPFGKQSVAFSGHAYTKRKTRQSMKKAAIFFLKSQHEITSGAVEMTVTAYFPRPNLHYGTGKYSGIIKERFKKLFCTVKPDLSNICKGIEDGLNKLAYKDDAYIVDLHYHKRYANAGEMVGVFVTIEEAELLHRDRIRPEHRQIIKC